MAINRWVSLGFESTFGTAVSGKYFLDPSRVSLDAPSDPFIRYGGSSGRGPRSITPGVYVPEGDLETVFDQWRVGGLLRAFVPEVNYQQQSPDDSGGASTTLAAQEDAGQTVLSVADATGFSVDDLVQIGDDNLGSEVHKLTAVDDVLDTLTIEDPLTRTHASGTNVVELAGQATPRIKHIFDIGGVSDALDSVTVRVAKDFDEQVFVGSVLNQLTLSVDHNGLLNLTANVVSQKDQSGSVTALPAAGLVTTPWAGAHLSTAILEHDNPPDTKDIISYIRSAEFTFSNNIQGEDGVRMGSRFPIEHRAHGLDVTVRLTLVFRTRDQYEDFWGGATPQENAVTKRNVKLDFATGTDYTLGVYAFNCYTITPASEVSGRDMLVQTLEYVAIAPEPTSVQGAFQLQNTEEYRYF